MIETNHYMIQAVQETSEMLKESRKTYSSEFIEYVKTVNVDKCIDFDSVLSLENQRLIDEEQHRKEKEARIETFDKCILDIDMTYRNPI